MIDCGLSSNACQRQKKKIYSIAWWVTKGGHQPLLHAHNWPPRIACLNEGNKSVRKMEVEKGLRSDLFCCCCCCRCCFLRGAGRIKKGMNHRYTNRRPAPCCCCCFWLFPSKMYRLLVAARAMMSADGCQAQCRILTNKQILMICQCSMQPFC